MFRYFPYWPLFALLAIVFLGVAWGYLQITSPVYETKATILIEDEKKGVEAPRMVESLNIYTSKKIVENEIEVIKSKTLMRKTVEALQLASPIFEERMVSSYSAYTSSPVSVEVDNISEIRDMERANFSYDEETARITFNDTQYELNQWIDLPYGKIRFVKNAYLREQGEGPFYFSLIDPRKVTNDLLKRLSIVPSSKLSTVVSLSIRDVVPERGENVLNMLMELYNSASIDAKNSLAATTLTFVEERIRFLERDLDSLERSIEQYKSTRGIVNLSEQGKVFLQNVGDNDQKLSELDMQLAVLDGMEKYVVKKSKSRIVPSTLGVDDTRLSTLIQKLYEAEIEYERLKETTAENNPLLVSLRAEIENMRPGILENIRNQRLSLTASRANLASTNNKYTSILESIPQQERELLEANRQQSIKNNVYTFLLQKKEEAALSYASTVADSRLVDKAESSIVPVAPKKHLFYASALAVAFLLAIGVVSYKEIFSNKVLFRSDIESATKIPVASEISDSGLRNYPIVVDNPKRPFLAEQFRQLRASIGLYGKSSKKTLMVTSAIGGEGKSFICVNLATSLAQSNNKVLLLDLDLRNPRVSNIFKVANIIGVSEVLKGAASIEEAIRRAQTPNLFLIGAGKARENPTELLLSGNLSELFEKLRQLFDYIIVDTAPVGPVIDAYFVSPFCETTLFVIRHGKTPKPILNLLDQNLKTRPLNNISIVFNGVKSRGLLKNGYGNGYGYGYAYGYEYVYADRQKSKSKK